MMKNKIYELISGEYPACHFIRIGDNRNVSIYVGRDEFGRYSFDFRGIFKPLKTKSSEVINVNYIKDGDVYYMRFSLENPSLLEYFCAFCQDLMESTSVINDDETAYQALRTRYFSWKQLFRPNHGNLTEIEIMGLLGELCFLKDVMIPEKGIEQALNSWTGPEKTHKDFSFDDVWYEVKSVSVGKESVHISSIEQLDSNVTGFLVIYSLEKMSPTFNGVKLNGLVNEIIQSISSVQIKDLFLAKLNLYGFDFSTDNDNYVYDIKSVLSYKVDDGEFPRIKYENLPEGILKVQYDIAISQLEKYKA